jgi:hypothetical protein
VATLEELVISLTAETSGLRAELASAATATQDAAGKMTDAIAKFSESSGEHMNMFQSAMATAAGFLGAEFAEYAVEKAKEALGELVKMLEEGIGAAGKQETAFVRLANSLAMSGNYSEAAQAGLQSFAEEMQKASGIEAGVIGQNLALLSSLTKLDSEGLQKAQKAALDMSAALGIDLNTATHMVAKGIEGHIQAFARYGITIQEGSTKAETFANIINTLDKSFGGAAEGSMQTFEGSLRGLKLSFDDIFKAIGQVVVQNPVVIAMVRELSKVFDDLKTYVSENSDALRDNLANALLFVVDTLGTLLKVTPAPPRRLVLPEEIEPPPPPPAPERLVEPAAPATAVTEVAPPAPGANHAGAPTAALPADPVPPPAPAPPPPPAQYFASVVGSWT